MCIRAHIYNLFNRKKGGKLPRVSEKKMFVVIINIEYSSRV